MKMFLISVVCSALLIGAFAFGYCANDWLMVIHSDGSYIQYGDYRGLDWVDFEIAQQVDKAVKEVSNDSVYRSHFVWSRADTCFGMMYKRDVAHAFMSFEPFRTFIDREVAESGSVAFEDERLLNLYKVEAEKLYMRLAVK